MENNHAGASRRALLRTGAFGLGALAAGSAALGAAAPAFAQPVPALDAPPGPDKGVGGVLTLQVFPAVGATVPASSQVEYGPGQTWDTVTLKSIDDCPLIPLQSYSWSVTAPVSSGSGGAGAGKISFNPMTITRAADPFSILLFTAVTSGQSWQAARINVALAGQTRPYLSMMLQLVVVAGLTQTAGEADDGRPIEQVTLEFGAVSYDFTPVTTKGAPAGPSMSGGWNRVTNAG